MDLFITIFQMIGTVAFAVSGALTAMHKKMDLLGVIVLGVTTAVASSGTSCWASRRRLPSATRWR